MNHLVLDASVALKWFLLSEAPWEIQALGLLARYKAKEFELVVPDLFSGRVWKCAVQDDATGPLYPYQRKRDLFAGLKN